MIYLTGAPATGKSTLSRNLKRDYPDMFVFAYSEQLRDVVARRLGNARLDEEDIRRQSGMVVWAAAGSVDTDLSFLSFLKVYRTDIANCRMASRRVVEPLDVVKDVGPGLFPGPVHFSGRAFGFQ